MIALLALNQAILAPIAVGQFNETASIIGYVHDAVTHEPVMAARIDLMSSGGLISTNRQSSTNGEFSVNVRDGDYQLIVQKEGYETAKIDVSVPPGHQVRVDIDLQPVTAEAAPSSSEAVSAHQLTVPAKARSDYNKGMARMAKKDYAGAVALFQKSIEEYAPYYEAYAELGVTQDMMGQVPAARDSFQKSIDLSSGKYSNAIFDLADVFNSTHDYASAEPMARKGIAADDSSWRGYFELARALTGEKRFAEAEQSAVKSRTLNSDNLQLYVVLTNIHLGVRNYPSALEDIDAYLKRDPSSPASEQMRATRAQVARALAAAPAPSSSTPH